MITQAEREGELLSIMPSIKTLTQMSSENFERSTDKEEKENRKRENVQQTFKKIFGGCWMKTNKSQKENEQLMSLWEGGKKFQKHN